MYLYRIQLLIEFNRNKVIIILNHNLRILLSSFKVNFFNYL